MKKNNRLILHSDLINSRRGFTLLEILAAIALLGIALTVIFQLFSVNLKGIASSNDYIKAVIKAESKMREILSDDKLKEKHWEETTDDGYRISASVTSYENSRTENLPVELFEINLKIIWTNSSKQRTLTLKTLKVVNKQI